MGKYRSIVLAKLPSPPTLPMLREMLIKTRELPGSTVQIPFGNAGSEAYGLSACIIQKDEASVCSWILFRGESSDSAVEWSYVGDDAEQVISYLTTRFPGWSQQSKLLTPEVHAFKI
jgi:hypothetical protein